MGGRDTHDVVSRLHLHPGVTVEGAGAFVLCHRDMLIVFWVTACDGQWTTTRLSPRFGVAEPRPCLVVGGRHALSVRLARELQYSQ